VFFHLQATSKSVMVEESNGGVVLVGGFSQETHYDDIFRLPHAQATWQEHGRKLAHQREYQVAFLVPDSYTTCVPSS